MDLNEFGANLIRLHNYEDKPGLLIEIKKVLQGYTDNDLDRIFTKYTHNWRSDHSPRPAHFLEFAKSVQAAKTDESIPYHKCECGKLYSIKGTGCPACGSTRAVEIVLGNKLTPHIETQPSCYLCDHYMEKGAYGPTCQDWGRQELSWKPCHKCRCRHCCSWEVQYRKDPTSLPIDIAIKFPHELVYEEKTTSED